MRSSLWLFVAVIAGACGGSPARTGSPGYVGTTVSGGEASTTSTVSTLPPSSHTALAEPDRQLVQHYATDMDGWDDELGTALSTGDCDQARLFRDNICGLADRICDIAARNPDYDDVAAQCRDGRERCERSESTFTAHCAD